MRCGRGRKSSKGVEVMLSEAALIWLHSIDWKRFTHEERMILLQAAKIAYPNDEEDDQPERK